MSVKHNSGQSVPAHVAIIMDGNRRWAAKRGLGPVAGHKFAAEEAIKPIIKRAIKRGIKYLTFWAFSTENKKRDKHELHGLFQIFRNGLRKNVSELDQLGVQLRIVGDVNWFPQDIAQAARKFVQTTQYNSTVTVSFALNYGGREEILRALSRLLDKIQTHKRSVEEPVTEEEFSGLLDTAGLPDPDLVIRTGGNMRLSGYFPWQTVYSELYFTKTLWPDFTPEKFDKALADFAKRARRFGGGKFTEYLKNVKRKTRNASRSLGL